MDDKKWQWIERPYRPRDPQETTVVMRSSNRSPFIRHEPGHTHDAGVFESGSISHLVYVQRLTDLLISNSTIMILIPEKGGS